MSESNCPKEKRQLLGWPPPITLDHLWFALPVVLVIIMGFRHRLRLLDFWWHLKIGEIIVGTFSIPRTDIFSYTVEGETFVLQNWLTEAIYALVYRTGGLELLIVANTLVLVTAFLAIYHLCWDPLQRVRPVVLSAGFAVVALAWVYSNVRPQTFSFLFFAIFYWVLVRYSQNQISFPWTLPLLMAFWVNLHGAFVLGLGLIFLFLCCETVRRISRGPQPHTLSPQKLRLLLYVFVVTVVASLVNPETYKVYDYVLTVLRDPGSQIYVTEWQPPTFKSFSGQVCFYGPFLGSLLVILYSRRKLNLTELALYLGFAGFAVTSVRNGIWFSLIVSPIVARSLADLKPDTDFQPLRMIRLWSGARDSGASGRNTASPVNVVVAIIMLAGCILSTPWLRPAITGNPLWESDTPVAVFDFIESEQLTGHIFHPQSYGDYLIWRLWPHQKSFVDGRVHIFGGELVKDYVNVHHDSCWEKRLEPYDIDYLLLKASGESSEGLQKSAAESPNWELLYKDELSVLFRRTGR